MHSSTILPLSEAARIKDIEAITNHDVKAVEYWIKESIGLSLPPELSRLQARPITVDAIVTDELKTAAEFIHFCLYLGRHQQHFSWHDDQGCQR